ncbi:response regulator [Spirosoma sp. HMF3257]|uniref:Response regulatory domain-containing protein n=1 Tax=Spirosoma telluris TaxID=2183553 RepID=A0A327NRP0_9BACT|nr:response regulator [Spirosoma telluris]RAI78020.1 hypothetical protein HMF3257_35080 [Spirosoma telluris]
MNQFNTLIIEDDPIWLYRLQQMFTQLNLGPTRSATTLTQARQLIEEQLPDLVIADIVLPDGLSFELFLLNFKQLPVIFQTNFAREEFLMKAIRMPNIGFLVKPFEPFNLRASVELLISRMPYKPVSPQQVYL